MRILRESQWIFLKSGVQRFITEPGASKYWIGSGAAPAGCVNTGLRLSNVASVLPDSVYDLTNCKQLTQDSAKVKIQDSWLFKDGSVRAGHPASYSYEYTDPGILKLFPVPDNQNLFYPVPQAPLCSSVNGGTLGNRTYYTVATFVDSFGNEGTASTQPAVTAVPVGSLLQVQSPDAEVPSATNVTYNAYNVYVGTSFAGPFWKQNSLPIPLGGNWTELITGVTTSQIVPARFLPLIGPDSTLWNIGVTTGGLLQGIAQNVGNAPAQFLVADSNSVAHLMQVAINGNLLTTPVSGVGQINLMLTDSANNVWRIIVTTGGLLQTVSMGPASGVIVPSNNPPTNSTLTPLLGYVISFRYQQERVTITDPTNLLQIPFQYYDVVVAGVNYYANLYTAKSEDLQFKAGAWKREFMEGLAQIRRDLRVNFRNTDVIMPDPTTQYQIRGQSWYYGLN